MALALKCKVDKTTILFASVSPALRPLKAFRRCPKKWLLNAERTTPQGIPQQVISLLLVLNFLVLFPFHT